MAAVVVLTSVADDKQARFLAGRLVGERLAACVSEVGGMRSVYRWKGGIKSTRERLLLIKTSRRRLKDLESFFKKHHPYELPEFLVISAAASRAYFSWIETSLVGRVRRRG